MKKRKNMENKKAYLIMYIKDNIRKQYNEQFGNQVNKSERFQLPPLELPTIFEVSKEEEQKKALYNELEKMGIDESISNVIDTYCILKDIPSEEYKKHLIEAYELDDIYNENGIYRVRVEKNENKDKEFMLNVNEIYKLFDNYFMNFVNKKKLTPDDMKAAYDLLYTGGYNTSIKGSFECDDFLKSALRSTNIIDSEMADKYNKREIERLESLKDSLNKEEEKSGPRL